MSFDPVELWHTMTPLAKGVCVLLDSDVDLLPDGGGRAVHLLPQGEEAVARTSRAW